MAERNLIDADAVQEYVGEQILQCQINWMKYYEQGDAKLRDNEAAVLDKLFEFASLFFGTPIPAPGQGYQPPEGVWENILKTRELETIDAAVAELLARREEIAGRASAPVPTPESTPAPEPDPEPQDPGSE